MGTYAKSFEIPEGFPAILREFAKEAIREQPDDIYRFGYDYFENLLGLAAKDPFVVSTPHPNIASGEDGQEEAADGDLSIITLGVNQVETQNEGNESTGIDTAVDESLSDRIALLFQKADTDNNGTLSRMEFQQVFEMFGEGIGLTPKHVMTIMAEADNNDDGVIEYKEFLPAAAEMIKAIMAKEQYFETKGIRKKRASAKMDVQDYLMKGMPRSELEDAIQEIFRGADGDGSGALDRAEFLRCLKVSGLGFTRRELNLILTLIDKNGDGIIDYQEFMPVCFSMIVEILSDKVQEIPEEESALIERVRKILLEANGQNERLTSSAASECLANAGLGLRFVQVPAIMSAVEEGEDGLVEVEEVANAVAGIMCALNQMHSWQQEGSGNQTVTDFKVTRQAEGIATVAGLDADGFKEKLAAAFQAKDDGGTGTLATKSDIEETIKDVLPQLEPRQVLALDSLAQQRPDGRWVYEDVYKWGFRTLQEIQNQSILMKSCNKVAVLGK